MIRPEFLIERIEGFVENLFKDIYGTENISCYENLTELEVEGDKCTQFAVDNKIVIKCQIARFLEDMDLNTYNPIHSHYPRHASYIPNRSLVEKDELQYWKKEELEKYFQQMIPPDRLYWVSYTEDEKEIDARKKDIPLVHTVYGCTLYCEAIFKEKEL